MMKNILMKIANRFSFIKVIIWKLSRLVKQPKDFSTGSAAYWEERYAADGNSGVGSYGNFAEFKAEILNKFVDYHNIKSIIEFGCGDGSQLSLANYPCYTGFDISASVISRCKELYLSDETKNFRLVDDYNNDQAELVLSLDVIYHLVEDDVFCHYMQRLFSASESYVIIYSSDSDMNYGYEGTYIWHRKFSKWVNNNAKDWKLIEKIPNKYPFQDDYRTGSFADFYIYEKL